MSKRHPGSRNFAKLDRRRWQLTRLRVFERDGWRCVSCCGAGRLECDHVRPLADGGDPYDMDNLQSLCRTCHRAKTAGENAGPPMSPGWRALIDDMAF